MERNDSEDDLLRTSNMFFIGSMYFIFYCTLKLEGT